MTLQEFLSAPAFQLAMVTATVSPLLLRCLLRRRRKRKYRDLGDAPTCSLDIEAARIAKRKAKEDAALERKRAKERKVYATGGATERVPVIAERPGGGEAFVPLGKGRSIPVNVDPVVTGTVVGTPDIERTDDGYGHRCPALIGDGWKDFEKVSGFADDFWTCPGCRQKWSAAYLRLQTEPISAWGTGKIPPGVSGHQITIGEPGPEAIIPLPLVNPVVINPSRVPYAGRIEEGRVSPNVWISPQSYTTGTTGNGNNSTSITLQNSLASGFAGATEAMRGATDAARRFGGTIHEVVDELSAITARSKARQAGWTPPSVKRAIEGTVVER